MAYSLVWVVCSVLMLAGTSQSAHYLGKSLGKLSELHHAVSGHVYAVDGRTLFIKNFKYDGEGPAAYFYVGSGKSPSNVGAQRLRDERGSAEVLKPYRGADITLTLPEGKTLSSVKWFSIWCDEFSVNFGDVKIPRSFDFPKPQKIGALSGVHGVSSDHIVLVDAQTLLIPNFSYDGEAPDAKFWVGRGDKPSPQGTRIPDENGKEAPLIKYDRKTIVLTLPGDLTIFDIRHFGVWCEAFTVDFGHIKIPELPNVPPSLKMLGVSPQSKLNCEVLYDDLAFEVRWAVAGESVVIQLVAKLEDGEYMSFGISGEEDHSRMVGADVAVAWVDRATLKGYAADYFLDAKSQCAGQRGSCPDDRLAEKTNSVRLLNAAMVNGYSIVTYQRPLKAADELDKPVFHDKPQPIVWAVGPLNSRQEVSYHTHFTKADKFLDFGRPPAWNCPMPEMDEVGEMTETIRKSSGRQPASSASSSKPVNNGQYLVETSSNDRGGSKFQVDQYDSDIGETTGYKEQATRRSRPVPTPKPAPRNNAWEIPPINCYEPEDGVFYAQMGPTGGKQGYSAITGHVGWGISWYINGLLIPEINVVRGKSYTFVVEGGIDPNVPARYHPFYITDDPQGGYEHKTDEERANIKIFAGVQENRRGDVIPTGVGRLCNWTPDIDGPGADEYGSFGAYQRSLTLQCDQGEPGVVTWTPGKHTPDTVYYQCFTHRYLGWKINVLDSCESSAEASEVKETFTSPDRISTDDDITDDLVSRPSIRVATRVKPDNNFAEQQKDSSKQNSDNPNLINSAGNRVTIREIAGKPKDNIIIGESVNSFSGDLKMVSPEQNPRPELGNNINNNNRPDINIPISQNQFKQVIDFESNQKNNNKRDETFERHPVYHHSTPASNNGNNNNKDQGNQQRNPSKNNNEEFLMDVKNVPTHLALQSNQKPMTLQTFMRPHGKPPMMGNNNMYFRRPSPQDMRLRRPGMQKPMMNMPNRMPPPFMMGQPNFMSPHKMYKNPPFNRPPINGFGRLPIVMPQGMKSGMNNNNNNNIAMKNSNINGMNNNNNGMNNNNNGMHGNNNNGIGQKYNNGHGNGSGNKSPNGQSIILGKPSLNAQTLTLGQPTIIGQQVVKSQMSLPPPQDNSDQLNPPITYVNKPGQIIMGKPMDNPIPLDQQMMPTKHHIAYTNFRSASTTPKTHTSSSKIDIVHAVSGIEESSRSPANITPSELMNSSANPPDVITLTPAVNTGFKPDSVVIEGGFKPIIREPLLSGQDRITDYDDDVDSNRRNDSESSESEEEEEPNNQLINNDFYEKQLTQSFEPMFIPSPPDRHIQRLQNGTNNNDSNKRLEYVEIGPRPVYVFPESKSNSDNSNKKTLDDMTMAADRVDAYYLPPINKARPVMAEQPDDIELPAGTVVSYDGHTVSDMSLTSPQKTAAGKYSSKLSSNSELLTKTPQFGPFKGEIPSLIQGQIGSTVQVTKLQSVSNSHNFPGSVNQNFKGSNSNTASKATHLTLVNSFDGHEELKNVNSDVEYDASEIHEEIYDEVKEDDEEEEEVKKVKREAHHTPDHTDEPKPEPEPGHDHDHSMHDHDHSDHDHSHHDHSDSNSSQSSQEANSAVKSFTHFMLVPLCVLSSMFVYC